jgi:hypothetical protein
MNFFSLPILPTLRTFGCGIGIGSALSASSPMPSSAPDSPEGVELWSFSGSVSSLWPRNEASDGVVVGNNASLLRKKGFAERDVAGREELSSLSTSLSIPSPRVEVEPELNENAESGPRGETIRWEWLVSIGLGG